MVPTSEWASLFPNGTQRSPMHCAMERWRSCLPLECLAEGCLVHEVPGAFELPLATKWMLDSSPSVDAVIAIGSVIRGETAHFDFVCEAASTGVLRAGMDSGRPAIFCVLTDDTMDQSKARSGGTLGNKGIEAAIACLDMLTLKNRLFPAMP